MKIAAAGWQRLLRAAAVLLRMVIFPGVQVRMNYAGLRADMLEDVDLAALRPLDVCGRHHPESWPASAGARQLRARFKEAVLEGGLALRDDLGRAVFLLTPVRKFADLLRIFPQLDGQIAATHAEVLKPVGRVILELLVVPPLLVARGVILPLRCIQPRAVEFI